jgi:hypothetical protein
MLSTLVSAFQFNLLEPSIELLFPPTRDVPAADLSAVFSSCSVSTCCHPLGRSCDPAHISAVEPSLFPQVGLSMATDIIGTAFPFSTSAVVMFFGRELTLLEDKRNFVQLYFWK